MQQAFFFPAASGAGHAGHAGELLDARSVGRGVCAPRCARSAAREASFRASSRATSALLLLHPPAQQHQGRGALQQPAEAAGRVKRAHTPRNAYFAMSERSPHSALLSDCVLANCAEPEAALYLRYGGASPRWPCPRPEWVHRRSLSDSERCLWQAGVWRSRLRGGAGACDACAPRRRPGHRVLSAGNGGPTHAASHAAHGPTQSPDASYRLRSCVSARAPTAPR